MEFEQGKRPLSQMKPFRLISVHRWHQWHTILFGTYAYDGQSQSISMLEAIVE